MPTLGGLSVSGSVQPRLPASVGSVLLDIPTAIPDIRTAVPDIHTAVPDIPYRCSRYPYHSFFTIPTAVPDIDAAAYLRRHPARAACDVDRVDHRRALLRPAQPEVRDLDQHVIRHLIDSRLVLRCSVQRCAVRKAHVCVRATACVRASGRARARHSAGCTHRRVSPVHPGGTHRCTLARCKTGCMCVVALRCMLYAPAGSPT